MFVTFEGSDGSGKTTVLSRILPLLQEKLTQAIITTREPGGNPISEQIRALILDHNNHEMDAKTEALLYAAARRQHLVDVVLPALAASKLVLCDRFVDSSLAYQGAGRQLGVKAVADLNLFATEGLKPDLTLYFDLDPAIGLARIKDQRAKEINRLDEEKLEFYHQVRQTYLDLAQNEPERIKVIDASQPLDQVVAQTLEILVKEVSA